MRPIDADAITYCCYDLDNYHWFRAVDEDEIAEMPTLTLDDLRPKGRWILLGQRTYGGGRGYTHYCSECGRHGFEDYTFCPSCGADMRGGGEDA